MNYENKARNQSLKCNFPPGGNSNFSLGWGQSSEPVKSLDHTGKNYGSNIQYTSNNYFDKENVNKSKLRMRDTENRSLISSKKLIIQKKCLRLR